MVWLPEQPPARAEYHRRQFNQQRCVLGWRLASERESETMYPSDGLLILAHFSGCLTSCRLMLFATGPTTRPRGVDHLASNSPVQLFPAHLRVSRAMYLPSDTRIDPRIEFRRAEPEHLDLHCRGAAPGKRQRRAAMGRGCLSWIL